MHILTVPGDRVQITMSRMEYMLFIGAVEAITNDSRSSAPSAYEDAVTRLRNFSGRVLTGGAHPISGVLGAPGVEVRL